MNWISKLLRKPAAKPAVPSSPRRSAQQSLVDDTERLRRALIAAANDAELKQAASALGCALAGLLQAPQAEDPPEVWVAAVCQVSDKALALAWTARLEGDAWLGEAVIHGRFFEVRLAAVQRIEDSVVLERIARISRDKDKRVYRHCFDLLRQRRQTDEDACRATELAAALRDLLDVAPVPLSRLLDLEKELRTLGEGAQWVAECNALLDQAHARLQQESLAQRDLQVRKAAAQLLIKECSNVEWTAPAQLDDWRVRLETLAKAQLGLPPWLSSQTSSRRLDELLRDIECRLAVLGTESESILAGEQCIAAYEASRPVDAESSLMAAAAWAALSKPENPVTRQSLELRWLALQTPADSTSVPAEPPPPPVRIDLDAVRHLLEKVERDVEQGHLADAESAVRALGDVLGGNRLHGEMESRLQRANAQLGKLRGWARWGTGQARENLITAAELLIGVPSVDDLAQGVQELREKWKQLDAYGPTAKDQWERFDAALEKAYRPVVARQAAEAVRQAGARAAKVALCVEWESYFVGIVWEHVDYKVLEEQRQEMLRRWRSADQAGFRDERMLRKRLDKLLNSIDQRLDAMRAAELERREKLIAEAEALRELSDLGRAMKETKALQNRWNQQASPLRLNRGDEQRLWRRFRAACAEVFARRDAQRAQQVVQREERTQALRGLLDAFVVALADTDVGAIKRALSRFRADWEAARASSREFADGIEARARDLQQQAVQRIEMLLHAKHQTHFELLAKKSALADGVEAAAVALVSSDAILAAAKLAWDELPRLPGKTESLLAERFARAPGATATELASGREARELMLLDLEIALGLPSPDVCTEARRRRQLERLQSRFGADSQQSPEAEALLVRWYATAATPDMALEQRMTAVKRKLLELHGDTTGIRKLLP